MSLVSCKSLPLKLHHFFEFAAQSNAEPFPIKDKAAIAQYLKIERARVTEWTRADESKARESNMVQEHHVERLAELYSQLAPGPVLPDEAYRFWRYSGPEAFRDGLIAQVEHRDLFSLLAKKDPLLSIKVEERPDALGMMDDMAEPAAGACNLDLNQQFAIHVEKTTGRSVYVLVDAPEGVFKHVPGKTFDGVLRDRPQRLPPNRWWRFSSNGPHRIIVIELSAEAPPFIRDPSAQRPLTNKEIRNLVTAIEDPYRVASWNWGSVAIHVGYM